MDLNTEFPEVGTEGTEFLKSVNGEARVWISLEVSKKNKISKRGFSYHVGNGKVKNKLCVTL